MAKRLLTHALLIFISGLLVASYAEDKNEKGQWDIRQKKIEQSAPDFSLPDLMDNRVSLSEFRGQVVLLMFVTTWCPYCKRELPNLKRMYETYSKRGLKIIAIFIRESRQKVAPFASAYKLPYTVLLDTSGMVARSYGVIGVPTKILIGKDGKIYCRACRSIDMMLQKLLGGNIGASL